jgi:hypothetical protein
MEPIYIQTGTRKIMNTDWPVENKVEKVGRKWRVTWGICNGTASGSSDYATKAEAMRAVGNPAFTHTED